MKYTKKGMMQTTSPNENDLNGKIELSQQYLTLEKITQFYRYCKTETRKYLNRIELSPNC